MKRKMLYLAAVMMLCICCLTGCIRYRIEVEVQKTGDMNISMLIACSDTLMEQSGQSSLDDQIKEYSKQGFTSEKYSSDGYTGFILTRNDYDPIEEMSKADDDEEYEELFDGNLSFEKNSDGNYELYIPLESMIGEYSEQSEQMIEVIKSQDGFMELKLILPCEPVSSNATVQEGRELTWDLLSPDCTSIRVEVDYPFLLNRIVAKYWYWGVALVVLIVALIVLIAKRRRSNNFYYN